MAGWSIECALGFIYIIYPKAPEAIFAPHRVLFWIFARIFARSLLASKDASKELKDAQIHCLAASHGGFVQHPTRAIKVGFKTALYIRLNIECCFEPKLDRSGGFVHKPPMPIS